MRRRCWLPLGGLRSSIPSHARPKWKSGAQWRLRDLEAREGEGGYGAEGEGTEGLPAAAVTCKSGPARRASATGQLTHLDQLMARGRQWLSSVGGGGGALLGRAAGTMRAQARERRSTARGHLCKWTRFTLQRAVPVTGRLNEQGGGMSFSSRARRDARQRELEALAVASRCAALSATLDEADNIKIERP